MIVDTLGKASTYFGLSTRISEAFRWLESTDLDSLDEGRVEIQGDSVFALVQSYQTVLEDGRRYEAHRKYVDIQFLVRGTERMLVKPVADLTEDGPYDAERDIVFCAPAGARSGIVLQARMFAVFFPQDAHMPMLAADSATNVKKIVVKVAV